jgi:hypothetical protein
VGLWRSYRWGESLLHRTQHVNYLFWRLVISAEGYKRVKDDLEQYTRDPRFHSDTIPPAIVIRLHRETSIPQASDAGSQGCFRILVPSAIPFPLPGVRDETETINGTKVRRRYPNT